MKALHNYHYLYKTTCNITGRFYIGMHSTNDLNDGYIGSGIQLWRSIRKHGKPVHLCEILEYCETRNFLKNREIEVVTETLIKDPMCMNMKIGGDGGGIRGVKRTEQTKQNIKLAQYNLSDEARENRSLSMKGNKNAVGYTVSDQHKSNLRQMLKGNTRGLGYKMTDEQIKKRVDKVIGKKWCITNGIENKFINISDASSYLSSNVWKRGLTLNNKVA